MTTVSVGALLTAAVGRGLARLEVQRLMSHVLGQPRAWLLAHGDERVDDTHRARFEQLIARRLDDEPLAYLLGSESFHDLTFDVSPAVLVPRADTETLVDWALECIALAHRDAAGTLHIVDLGTGSGAIAVTVAARGGDVSMTAVDVSDDALAVARRNAARHGVHVDWQRGSWWVPLDGRRFGLALSNPPYIAAGDAHLPALRHEPTLALVSGAEGLDALREIIEQAPSHLRTDAWLLVEHGFDQGAAVRSLFTDAGFKHVQTRRDGRRQERCTGGQRSVIDDSITLGRRDTTMPAATQNVV